jgi:hypothetical protein
MSFCFPRISDDKVPTIYHSFEVPKIHDVLSKNGENQGHIMVLLLGKSTRQRPKK